MSLPANAPDALLEMPTYALSLLGREAHDRLATTLPPGLRLGHLAVLGALSGDGAQTQRAIADLLRIHASDIVSIIDDLVARDMVSREADPDDRRRNLLRIRRAGRQLVKRATRDSRRITDELFSALADQERRHLEQQLRQALARATGR